MNKIRLDIGDRTLEYSYPQSFDECDGRRLIFAARIILYNSDDDATREFIGIPKELFSYLSKMHILSVRDSLSWITETTESMSFREWKIPTIELDGELYYGPMSNFGNVTWGEFIYADQCMANGMLDAAIAAMFRQKMMDYDGETDIRVPFTIFGTVHRHGIMSQLDESTKLAIILNYMAMRRASIEETYTYMFNTPVKHQEANDNLPDDTPADPFDSDENHTVSWTMVHRNLIRENICEEEKFLNLNVHTVLHFLNNRIMEYRRPKHA